MKLAVAIAIGICLVDSAAAQERAPNEHLNIAVKSGLEYLAKQQKPDGSLDGGAPKVAMTGLALMSYLAAGHAPDDGHFGPTVRHAVDYLVRAAPEDGYFGKL